MSVLVDSGVEIANRMIVPVYHPFGGEQALQSDRTSRMNFASRNSDLRTQTESVAIGESAAAVVKYTGTIHSALEVCSVRA